jgi:hypothetical protein
MASIWRWYTARLASHPLPTKMVTSSVILGAADVTAQLTLDDKNWDAKRFVFYTHATMRMFESIFCCFLASQ